MERVLLQSAALSSHSEKGFIYTMTVPDLQGFLCKKTRQDRWQRRYFIAKTHYLTCYKVRPYFSSIAILIGFQHQDSDKLLACIDLWQIQSIQSNPNDPTEFSIDLGEQSYFLKATDAEEADMWLSGLKSRQDRPQFTSSDALSVQSGLESDASSSLFRQIQQALPTLRKDKVSEAGSAGERSVKSLTHNSGATINPIQHNSGPPNYTNSSLNPIVPNAIKKQTLSPNLKLETTLPTGDRKYLEGNINATCCIPSCMVM
ncbi:unnamed protein product [Albugo candida]|uniref:PH domain-containing protein n=2 Tax=Albugo candida TaxID=65357 RepID=A0A024G0Z1_9STRA|nr:unnamed protein product [Albugo candida]|eukprot:CCI40404.1 unnamed protein product [Albugo candida]